MGSVLRLQVIPEEWREREPERGLPKHCSKQDSVPENLLYQGVLDSHGTWDDAGSVGKK